MLLILRLFHSDYLLGSSCVQGLVKHLPLIREIMAMLVVSWETVSLPLTAAIGHSWMTTTVIVRRSRNYSSPGIILLLVLHLCLIRQLLVRRRGQASLT